MDARLASTIGSRVVFDRISAFNCGMNAIATPKSRECSTDSGILFKEATEREN
jgi:hypothetical protein